MNTDMVQLHPFSNVLLFRYFLLFKGHVAEKSECIKVKVTFFNAN